MSEVCPMCGLVKELCVCETIAKESQKILVYLERKKFNKNYTIVEGIDEKEIDLKDLAKGLSQSLHAAAQSRKERLSCRASKGREPKKFWSNMVLRRLALN